VENSQLIFAVPAIKNILHTYDISSSSFSVESILKHVDERPVGEFETNGNPFRESNTLLPTRPKNNYKDKCFLIYDQPKQLKEIPYRGTVRNRSLLLRIQKTIVPADIFNIGLTKKYRTVKHYIM
jgi:hypothetical protein